MQDNRIKRLTSKRLTLPRKRGEGLVLNEKPVVWGCKAEFTWIVGLSVVHRVVKQCSLAIYVGIENFQCI